MRRSPRTVPPRRIVSRVEAVEARPDGEPLRVPGGVPCAKRGFFRKSPSSCGAESSVPSVVSELRSEGGGRGRRGQEKFQKLACWKALFFVATKFEVLGASYSVEYPSVSTEYSPYFGTPADGNVTEGVTHGLPLIGVGKDVEPGECLDNGPT